MTSDESAFWRAIDARPGDLLPVSILADWLDEHSDPRAQCLRYCVARRRIPKWCALTGTWDWWRSLSRYLNTRNRPYMVPAALVRLCNPDPHYLTYTQSPSPSAAYRALCDAWVEWKNR